MKRQLERCNRRINPPRCPILTCAISDLPNETWIRIYDKGQWHVGIIYNRQCGDNYILGNFKAYHGRYELCIYNNTRDQWELIWPQQKDTKDSQE